MGEEVPGPGSLARQAMLSFSDQATGTPVSSLVPEPRGPRNWLQSAPSVVEAVKATASKQKPRRMGRSLSAGGQSCGKHQGTQTGGIYFLATRVRRHNPLNDAHYRAAHERLPPRYCRVLSLEP